jgi:hypothetical protein
MTTKDHGDTRRPSSAIEDAPSPLAYPSACPISYACGQHSRKPKKYPPTPHARCVKPISAASAMRRIKRRLAFIARYSTWGGESWQPRRRSRRKTPAGRKRFPPPAGARALDSQVTRHLPRYAGSAPRFKRLGRPHKSTRGEPESHFPPACCARPGRRRRLERGKCSNRG